MSREVINSFTEPYSVTHVRLLSAGYLPRQGFGAPYALTFGQSTKAVLDQKCPDRETYIYRNSSCEPKLVVPPLKEIKRVVRYLKKKDVPGWDAALYER